MTEKEIKDKAVYYVLAIFMAFFFMAFVGMYFGLVIGQSIEGSGARVFLAGFVVFIITKIDKLTTWFSKKYDL